MPEAPMVAEQNNTDTWAELARSIKRLNGRYGSLGMGSIFSAWTAAGGFNLLNNWPQIQNARIKGVNTRAADYGKDEIAEMVQAPGSNERALRAVSASLDSSAMTYSIILDAYQNIPLYNWYVFPSEDLKEVGYEQMRRDYILTQKLAEKINPSATARKINGQCAKYGKVFYTPRYDVDKSHNAVKYAFLQQLPTDWCMIVGENNGPGKYSVAFNLMYFCIPGTDPRQFGDLFTPYLDAFSDVVEVRDRYVYTSKDRRYGINAERFRANDTANTVGNPTWYQVGTTNYYWVNLPADKVIVFERNDRTVDVVPETTGMMVSMVQVPAYEAAQLEIILNPLTSIMTGEIPTYDTNGVPGADPMAISPATRELFEAFWYQMLANNNTSGIGLYLAPAKNLKLQTITDTVSSTSIAEHAYSDQVQKAGLAAVIPTSDDPKVGVAELSAKVAAQAVKPIYWTFERMMNAIFDSLNLKTLMRFHMFGDVFSYAAEMENARKDMTLGLMPATLKYNAMIGHSILDDLAISEFVTKSGIMDRRLPLVSTYSARQRDGTLPPQAEQVLNPGGRPSEPGSQSGQKNRDFLKNPGGSLDPTGHRVIPKDRDEEDHWDDF
jgi:hypothetical protein